MSHTPAGRSQTGFKWTYSRSQGVGPAIQRGKLLNTGRGGMGGIPVIHACSVLS